MAAIQLIAGLGNPGAKYEQTRHNAGFWFADEVARLLARLRHAAADQLLDVLRIDARTIDDATLHPLEQLRRMEGAQLALDHLAARDRGSQCLDDDGFSHVPVSCSRVS